LPSADPRSFLYFSHIATVDMFRFFALFYFGASSVGAFSVQPQVLSAGSVLFSKKGDADEDSHSHAFSVGTFVEFEEKTRVHVGKILQSEHKTNGARYEIEDNEGKKYQHVADKAVNFAIPAPNSPAAASKLFDEFCKASKASEKGLLAKLDISTELLELAWEESEEAEDHLLTAPQLVELVHSHVASAIEKYMAWKLLRSETSHVFFKEIKDHGRVVAFKAKARDAVEASKEAFCRDHGDSDLCVV
jgi:hypothetical protein